MVKVKQVNVTANYAWSPNELHPIQIATATAAQQLDATFSTSASLSLYNVDLSDPSQDLKLIGRVPIPNRSYKIVWGKAEKTADNDSSAGLLVCGADNGVINIYDPTKLSDNPDSEGALVNSSTKHTGPVRALDFNPFQKNLYASGASESEIYIWDLKNPSNPMTPGKKTEPLAGISSVAWNCQVQHILGSSTSVSSGPCCVVWDLRKNEPIIKVQDPSGRMQCSEIAWHPEVATQLVLASEDDRSPVVQLWDLRFATSPLRVLENHQRGVVSLAWCHQDPDLLMTCAKDNRVLCWNPNCTPSEVLHEIPSTAQWCFDVQWCPRNPAMISIGSFDGCINIHSLMGGSCMVETVTKQQQDVLAESFGGSAFTPVAPDQQPQTPKKIVSMPLKKPPKWICKPCGASFAFGGKLVSFTLNKPAPGQQLQQQEPVRRTVSVSQVVTETDFIARSNDLQEVLSSNKIADYCQKKINDAESVFEEDVWSFLKARFGAESRKEYLQLLGYNSNEIKTKISNLLGNENEEKLISKLDEQSLSSESSEANQSANAAEAFEIIASNQSSDSIKSESPSKPLIIPSGDKDPDSLISQALLVGDYESAVNLCLSEDRMADAIVLAIAGGSSLLEQTQKEYFARSKSKIRQLMFAIAMRKWTDIVQSCDLANWKEALATLLTYADKTEMVKLSDELGSRLESSPSLKLFACLCYICSGNVERLVKCWDDAVAQPSGDKSASKSLQDLVEKVMVLQRAVQGSSIVGQATSQKLATYASILASQGKFEAAMKYLPESSEKMEITALQNRLMHALGTPTGKQLQQPRVNQQYQHESYLAQAPSKQIPTYGQTSYDNQSQIQTKYQTANTFQPKSSSGIVPESRRNDATANNPYASKLGLQSKPGYVAPAPTNMYVPQEPSHAPLAHQPLQPYGFTSQVANQTATSTYQSQPLMNSGPMVPQTQTIQAPLSQEPMLAAGLTPNAAGWNDPPTLDPNRMPRKKKTVLTPTPHTTLLTPSTTLLAPTSTLMTPSTRVFTPAPGGTMPMSQQGRTALNIPTESNQNNNEGIFSKVMDYMKPLSPLGKPTLQLPFTVEPVSQAEQNLPQPFSPQNYNIMTPTTRSLPDPNMPVPGPNLMHPGMTPVSESHYINQPGGPPGAPMPAQPQAPAPSVPTAALKDVPKAPIPAEHQILQTHFEGVIKKCLASASNAQTKRKLDDCERRLEFLYDKLRASTLSPNIVSGLHQVAQFVSARDYASALRQHTQIVSNSNFSEISAFMPGLKSMLQIASQLRV